MTDEERPKRRREASGADGIEEVRNITLGTARAEDYSASDISPVSNASVAELREMLESPDAPTRRRSTLALAERDCGRDTVRELESLSRTDPDDEVRQFAIEAVGKLDGDPAVPREVLTADEDPWVRAEATVALDRIERDVHEDYFETLLDDDISAVRRNALISLTRIRGDDMREELIDALKDSDDRVREWAAKLLGTFDDDPAVKTALRSIAEDDGEVDIVRETAARSLGTRGKDIDSVLETTSGAETAGDHMLNQIPDK